MGRAAPQQQSSSSFGGERDICGRGAAEGEAQPPQHERADRELLCPGKHRRRRTKLLICCAKTIGLVNLADSVAAFYTADGKAAFRFGTRFSFVYRDSAGQRHPAPRIVQYARR